MIAYPETDMSAKRNDHTVVELSVIYNTYFVQLYEAIPNKSDIT